MSTGWWRLPGPARYVQSVAAAALDGTSVVLSVPAFTPGSLESALRHALDHDGRQWLSITVPADSPLSPGGFLQSLFGGEGPPDLLPTARNLARLPGFAGRILWLEGVSSACWPAWRSFLTAYAEAVRADDEWHRTIFVVPFEGEPDPAITEDVTLDCTAYRNAASPTDMILYVAEGLRRAGLPPLHGALAGAVIRRVAAWDPLAADMLIADPPATLADPIAPMHQLAKDRGWTAATPVTWAAGTVQELAGVPVVHSALVAARADLGELNRRQWSAQVEVLFPLLEQRRQQLIGILEPDLIIPFTTRFGTIHDRADLELGHLEAQVVFHRIPSPPGLAHQLQVLREIRNTLSHLRPLRAELLLGSALTAALAGLW